MTPEQVEFIRLHPDEIDSLSGREFEELVAELLASFQWDVNLTSATRDGGFDVLGVSRDPSGLETTWAVECKRYSADRPVSVEILRSLYGVKEALRITQGVLVTTSRVTRDAERFTASVKGLQIVDRARLLGWLGTYQVRPSGIPHIEDRGFQSCFISHSTKDEDFAEQLHADLLREGVRCWFAPRDIEAGKKLHEQIGEAIESSDRLLLILSKDSMNSEWVKTEIAHARQKEFNERRQVLFPISLVPFVQIRDWKCFDADSGKDSAREIREYFIPDFSNWKDHDSYQKALQRLVRDLKAEEKKTVSADEM